MDLELIAVAASVVGIGVANAGLILRLSWLLNRRIDRLEDRIGAFDRHHEERLNAANQRWEERMDASDGRREERIDALDRRWEEWMDASDRRWEARFAAIERGMAELRERMARLEGLLEGLRESISRAAA